MERVKNVEREQMRWKLELKDHIRIDMNHSRKRKSNRFSRASGTDSHHITTAERHGPSLTLNRTWGSETSFSELAIDVIGETGLGKTGDWFGNIPTKRLDLLFLAILVDILIRSSSDSRILVVEVFLREKLQWNEADVLEC